jgi:uncharacterized protein (TIGR02996 family)
MAKRGRSTRTPAEQSQETTAHSTSCARAGPVLHGLLGDIKANPDDDALRLILADWLEEQGDPRGEHVRLQCQLARMEEDDPDREALAMRTWEVEQPHRDEWLGPLASLGEGCRFARGLIQIRCDADTLLGPALEAAVAAESRAWLEGLTLYLLRATPEAIAQALGSPHLARFSALTLQRVSSLADDPSLERWAEGLRTLAASPHLDALKELNLGDANLRGEGLRLLLSSQHLGGITSLDLSHNWLDATGAEALAGSPVFGGLVNLDLSSNRIGRAGVEALARSRQGCALRSLNLDGADMDDEGVRILVGSSLLEHCTRLRLESNNLTGKGVEAIAGSAHLSRLSHLSLGSAFPAGLQSLFESPNLPSLTSLKLMNYGRYYSRHSPGEDAALEILSASPLFGRLERLNLARHQYGVRGLTALGAALAGSRLRFLNLAFGSIQAMQLQALAEGLENSALVGLDLGSNRLEVYGAQVLSRYPLPGNLRWLGLRSGHINSKGVALLASSGALRGLSYLDLSDNATHGEGAKALAGARLDKLTSLNLANCALDAPDARGLTRAPWAAGLGYLNLGQNSLRDEGIKALAASPLLVGLRWLGLQRTRLSGAGALALTESPHLERLEVLDLRDNRLSKKAVEALRQRFGARVLL